MSSKYNGDDVLFVIVIYEELRRKVSKKEQVHYSLLFVRHQYELFRR